MPTDTTIIDRLRDEDTCWSPQSGYDIAGMRALMRDAADALIAAHTARDAWRSAALRVGEDMATVGPVGYYEFTPDEWRAWALITLATALRERDEARAEAAKLKEDIFDADMDRWYHDR